MKDALGLDIPEETGSKKGATFRFVLKLLILLIMIASAGVAAVVVSNNYTDEQIGTTNIENIQITLDSIRNELVDLRYRFEVNRESQETPNLDVALQEIHLEISKMEVRLQNLDEEYYRHLEIYHSYYK